MMDLIIPFLVIVFLILVNGLFVAAEFAIIGVRPSRIKQLSEEGNAVARSVHKILHQPGSADRYIATAQMGITLASLGLGMYAEPSIAHLIETPLQEWFGLQGAVVHSIAFVIALSIITYLHVVIGEMVPKSIALQNSEGAVLALNGPMSLAGKIFWIPVTFLNQVGLQLLKLIGIKPPSESSQSYTPEELEMIVSESQAGGMLNGHEEEMLNNIFDFGTTRVVDVMTPRLRIQALPLSASDEEVMEHLFTGQYNRIPVYEDRIDNIVGMLHLKDYIRQYLSGEPFNLRALIRQVPFVPDSLLVEKLLASFRKQHLHMAVVIDEHGGTRGIVTLEDLIEEVFGEVQDEFDLKEEAPLVNIAPGRLIARGDVLLEDIEDYVNLGERDHSINTIGGLVMTVLGRLARNGDELQAGDAFIRVEAVGGHTIQRVSITYSVEQG
jgi:CBS domain containing-hemolysin-like protein